jgi:hypothetical protein
LELILIFNQMTIKNIIMKKYIIMLLAVVTFGCGDKLEEFVPQDNVSDLIAFSDGTTALGTLAGIYSSAQDGDVFGGTMAMTQEFMADNVQFSGSFPTFQEVRDYVTISTNGSLANIYRDHYILILTANNVIAFVPEVPDPAFSDALKAQYVAEAKFLRAITYFSLVNLFAQPFRVNNGAELGVPIITAPFTGEVLLPSRNTVAEVHQQVINDLNAALPDLPTSHIAANGGRGRATQGAVRALLSRVHLYRGEWQQAADLAQAVINNPLYSLAADYTFFGQDVPEHVWTIKNSAIDPGSYATWFNGSNVSARGDAPFSSYLLAASDASDRRVTNLSRIGVDAENRNSRFTTKWPDAVNNSDDSPVIRTTEVYLNRAEALAELNGINAESLQIINRLRTRAGLPSYVAGDFANAAAFINAIMDERRKELAFEGHRRNDLLRKGRNLRPVGDTNFAAASFRQNFTIFPIPQREIDLNSNLQQNPGYL